MALSPSIVFLSRSSQILCIRNVHPQTYSPSYVYVKTYFFCLLRKFYCRNTLDNRREIKIRLNTSIKVFPQNGSFNDDYFVYTQSKCTTQYNRRQHLNVRRRRGAVVDADGGISTVVVLPRYMNIPRLIFALEKHIKKGVKWKKYRFVEMETT